MVAIAYRRGFQVRDVAAAARPGDAERDDLVAREHRRRDALFQLLRTEREDRRKADAVGHQRRAEATRTDRGEFLGDDATVEIVEALAVPAIVFGIAQAEDTGFGGLLVQFAGQFAFDLPAVDMRCDLARAEASDALSVGFLVVVLIGRTGAPIVESGQG